MDFAAIFGLGPLEILIIVAVVIVLFLPALLPKIARRAAETLKAVKQMTSDLEEQADAEEPGEDSD